MKLHLALDCGKLELADLWQRLNQPLDTANNNLKPFDQLLDLSSLSIRSKGVPSSPTHSSYSSPSPQPRTGDSLEDRPASEPPHSAFRPYLKTEGGLEDSERLLSKRAAEIEAFVSSLGHSKQGHLCLYCGKLYSRKYGLKIHIR